MASCGDLHENRVTGEKAVVLRGDEDGERQSALVNLIVGPGGAVVGEHVHPNLQESFLVLCGELGTRVAGAERTLHAGEQATAAAGVTHDWWNAGSEEASVLVEISPPETRLLDVILTMWGLANAGKTNAKGMPGPLQLALTAKEFDDVIRFTKPPRIVQRAIFGLLAPIGHRRGYRASYPEYLQPQGSVTPDPEVMALAGLSQSAEPTGVDRP